MITLEEATKYREQLRPAFAGYLTDGNISDRDVLAKLLDLVVRGSVLLDMNLEEEGYTINKIMRIAGVESPLLPFERLFLKELFGKSNEITPDEFKEIVRSRKLHKTIENNLSALNDFKIVKTELKFIANGKPVELAINGKKLESIEEEKKFYRIVTFFFAIWIFVGSLILLSSIYTIIKGSYGPVEIFGIPFVCIMLTIALAPAYLKLRKIKRVLKLKMKVVPAAKKKYEELFEFIQKYPLAQQRLDNEFMPFAVAFGLDTSWNRSFGITEEMVVISEAGRSDSLPAIPA